jgi:hypothetical protein
VHRVAAANNKSLSVYPGPFIVSTCPKIYDRILDFVEGTKEEIEDAEIIYFYVLLTVHLCLIV